MTLEDAARAWIEAAEHAERVNTDEAWLKAHEAFRRYKAAAKSREDGRA